MRYLVALLMISGCSPASSQCVPGRGTTCGSGGGDMGGSAGAKIFVTSAAYGSDLETLGGGASGIDGADKLCASAAAGAGLSGAFKAWISDSATDAIDRISDVGPWYLVSGMKAFNNKAGLITTPLVPIDIDQNGALVTAEMVWTGTHTGGARSTGPGSVQSTGVCNDWRGGLSSEDSATVGSTDPASTWTDVSYGNCVSERAHLYCLQQ